MGTCLALVVSNANPYESENAANCGLIWLPRNRAYARAGLGSEIGSAMVRPSYPVTDTKTGSASGTEVTVSGAAPIISPSPKPTSPGPETVTSCA